MDKVKVDLSSDGHLFDLNKRKEFIESELIHKLQLRHFVFYNMMPPILALLLYAFLYKTDKLVFTQVEVCVAVVLWFASGLGITIGYHRYFTHKSFKAKRFIKILLHIFGLIAGQGGVMSWAALHRQHHKYSDKSGDPHSPNLHGETAFSVIKGILHSHFTWMKKHRYPNLLHYIPDLIHDKDIAFLDRNYNKIFLAGIILPGIISLFYYHTLEAFLSGLLIGGLFRVIFLGNTIWAINSFLHRFGNRAFKTQDNSRNFALISPISFGESWHNNHHAFPGSSAFGLYWYQMDIGYYCIYIMKILGLVSDVKKPKNSQINSKLRSIEDEQ